MDTVRSPTKAALLRLLASLLIGDGGEHFLLAGEPCKAAGDVFEHRRHSWRDTGFGRLRLILISKPPAFFR